MALVVSPTGEEISGFVGDVAVSAQGVVIPAGVSGTGVVGNVLLWLPINDQQTPNWAPVNDSQSTVWTPVSTKMIA